MIYNDNVSDMIADVLLGDYISIYYVDAVTTEYSRYSANPEKSSMRVVRNGSDFFRSLAGNTEMELCDEDKLLFTDENSREKLLAAMKDGSMQDISCRITIDGRQEPCIIRLIRGVRDGDESFILGVRRKEESQISEAEMEIYDHIAHSLAGHYDTIYYVDVSTNYYIEFSSTDKYKSLGIPKTGGDFFNESAKNGRRIIHPDDLERVLTYFDKEAVLKTLDSHRTVQHEYRIMLGGNAVNMRYSLIWASDKRHIIICLENIDEEILVRQKYSETQRKSAVYANIAESLASHYDVIYYVNSRDGSFLTFNSNMNSDYIALPAVSSNFYEEAQRNVQAVIHPNDRERLSKILNNEYIISALDDKKQFAIDYRMLIGGKPQYARMTVSWASDRVNFIIGVENINDEVRKERDRKQALDHANGLARRDTLTGTKNKFAYQELEDSLQESINAGIDYLPFAFLACEIVGLVDTFDSKGEKVAVDLVCAASRLICNVFKHSPVFRIDGGRFVVYLGSSDFLYRESLLARLQDQVMDNLRRKDGPVLAIGSAVYEPATDEKVSDVLARADSNMIADRTLLKAFKKAELPGNIITGDEKSKLDTLFDAFSLVSDGSYVFVCNMRYDFSKWSRKAVELFGLPSEYMYGAADIWENCIHPDDKETYRRGISDIFNENASVHDMQYRARTQNGEYVFCTCRGVVLRDQNGKPEYFCGAITNRVIQEQIDAVTGLRNQYGFFEDLQSAMSNHTSIRVYVININKFSEINEVYGYQFGNLVIQKFSRHLFERMGNSGHIYRLDGTKFAVISQIRTADEIREGYEKLREHFRNGINVDGKFVIIDLSAGLLSVDNFDIDYQTIYACLNFAYSESKLRRQGEMIEFYNDLNVNNRYRLEMLYSIRASIMQDCKGFYLLYQPVVDAESERLIGAEALLRWKSDEYGAVPPDSFIPILEKDPLFSELGQWILRNAIRGAKEIMKKHPDFIINVNLSYTQLEKPDFADMVLRTLREEDFPPERLCLEITERCRLLDMYLLKNVIVNLRGRGILIALDDFGTGFSSIGIMKNLPFDTIKIDRSFVMMIEQDQKERDLINSFVSMAATFSAKICVEGVETAGMRDILQQYNIQSFQGYYYAKPLELDTFISWEFNNN